MSAVVGMVAAGLPIEDKIQVPSAKFQTNSKLQYSKQCLEIDNGVGTVAAARDFMSRRRLHDERDTMNRLYVVESCPTGTGAVADHRLALRESDIVRFAVALAADLGVPGVSRPNLPRDPKVERWLEGVSADLRRATGRSIVVAGDYLPAEVHALVHAMNEELGNAGTTVFYTDPVEPRPARQQEDLALLAREMHAGQVHLLLVLDSNPVYTAPADLRFAEALGRVKLRFHLGLYDDETAELCHWHLPMAHFLESWSDVRAHDGTTGVQQPLIEPLYGGKSAHDLLANLVNKYHQAVSETLLKDSEGLYYVKNDPRMRALAILSPGFLPMFGERGLASVSLPIIILAPTHDEVFSYQHETVLMYNYLGSNDRYLINLIDGSHNSTLTTTPSQNFLFTAFFGYYIKSQEKYAQYLKNNYVNNLQGLSWGVYQP